MAINFPNSPAVNDTFTAGGINFTFTGVKWESGAVVELSSDTTPILGGNLDGGAKNINNVGVITATGFSGPLTGNVTGNATGLTGNPSIQVTNATVLGNLDVQGTTTTIDTAVTEVDSLSVDGDITSGGDLNLGDNDRIKIGIGTDLEIYHNGIDSKITNTTGNLIVTHSDGIIRLDPKTNENGILIRPDGAVELFHDNSKKLETSATGASITGSIDLPNVNSFITGGGHNVLQVDATRTYFYGGTNGVQLRTADNSSEIVTVDNVGNAAFDGTVSDSKGDLRKIIFKQESSAYTLVAADAGKAIEIATGGITVPNGVFGSGDAITIINDSGSSQSITKGTGLGSLFNVATGTSGNLTFAGRGMATIYFVNSTTCYISGGGLS